MKPRTALLLVGLPLGLIILGLASPNARAQTNSWTNSANGFWQDATSWSLGLAPAPTQSLLITNAGSKTVLADISTSSGYSNTLTVSDVVLAGQAGATNTLFVNGIGSNPPLHILNALIVNPGGALLSTNSSLLVDNANSGAVDIEGTAALSGTNIISGGVYVGFSTNSVASFSVIDGQTALTNGYVAVGFYGSAQLTLLGGTLQTEDDIIVTNGPVVGPGSTPNGLFVGLGPASHGTLSVSGGTLLVPEHFSLGDDPASSGVFWLTGGQVVATNNYLISIGGNGVGQTVISNGLLAASCLIVGNAAGASGTLTLAGGTVNLSGAMAVAQGQTATGSVLVSGGQLTVTNQSVTVAGFGVGQMTISNGSFLAQSVLVGDCEDSQGTLTIAGGTVSVASNLIAGARSYIGTATNANASGTIRLTGGILTVTNQSATGLLTVGQLGTGSFVQNGGLVVADQFVIAAASVSNITLSGTSTSLVTAAGQAIVSNGLFLAQVVTIGLGTNCPGTLAVAGGSLYVTNQSATGQLLIGQYGTGTFLQSGGTTTVDELLATNGLKSAFSLNSGLFSVQSSAVSNAETLFVGDGIDSATYHLLGGVHSFANGLEILSNAVLSGCGTVNGSVVVDPGGAVLADCGGVLTFTGTLTNNGDLVAANGGTIESYGPVVNNGLLDIIDGNTNFHAGFVNNGTVLTSNSAPRIISITAVGSNIEVQFTTATNLNYVFEYTGDLLTGSWTPLVGFIGPGGNVTVTDYNAILQTQRFYRVRLVVPQ